MRRLLLVVLSLAAVTGGWWLLRESSSAGLEPFPVLSEPASRAAPDREPRARGDGPEDPAPGRLRREEIVEPRRPTASAPARESVRRGEIEVRVVLAESGEPLPNAAVTFLDRLANPDWTRSWSEPGQRLAFLRTHGSLFTADEAGRLTIPETDSGALATRSVGYHGMVEWSTVPVGGIELALAVELDLHVRVLDETGRPRSGVPVVLVRESGGAPFPVITRQSAGSDAVATFPRIRQLLGGDAARGRHLITFGFPCLDPPSIAIDPLAPPTEPVDLRMPATGRLVVRVLDEKGQPLQEVANATLGASLDDEGRPIRYGATTIRIVGGRATFPFVGVGSTFELRLDGSRERPSHQEIGHGPTRPGEERELVVSWENRHPVLVGRAVSETGEPLVQRRGRYQLRRGDQAFVGPPITTDGAGRFRIVVDASRGPLAGAVLEASFYAARGEAPLETTIPLDRAPTPGETALGDIPFRPQPRLASGRVSDPAGTPLFGVHVRVEVEDADGSWRPQRDLSGTTDRDGLFTIHGRVEAGNLRVVALRQGYDEARAGPVGPGANGLELVLRPRGAR